MRPRLRPGAGPQGVAEGGDGQKPAHQTWSQEPCLAWDLAEKLSPPDIEEGKLAWGEQGPPGRRGAGPDGQGLPSRALRTSSSSNKRGSCSGWQAPAPGRAEQQAGRPGGRERWSSLPGIPAVLRTNSLIWPISRVAAQFIVQTGTLKSERKQQA